MQRIIQPLRPLLRLSLAVLLVGLVLACSEGADPATNGSDADSQTTEMPQDASELDAAREDPPLIVFLGDSLTAGYRLDQELSFPSLIEARLAAAGEPIEIVNAGISGDTTAGGLHRTDWLLRQQPDILVVCLGANDGMRAVDAGSAEENLRQILSKAQAKGVQVLLVGMLIPPNYGPEYSEQFAAIYPKLAEEFDVPLLPFLLEGVAADPSLNLTDGIHPNAEGYEIVATTVLQALRPLLDAFKPESSKEKPLAQNLDLRQLEKRYRSTWQLLDHDPLDSWQQVVAAYSETHRHYHSLTHLAECFEVLDDPSTTADRQPALELALWFHDVVYDVQRDDNEVQSARVASEVLQASDVPSAVIDEVTALILATQHSDISLVSDATQWMTDIDLSILGRDVARFDQYETQIRAEYAWVPDDVFRQTRSAILQGFLDRDVIYHTPWIHDRFEAPARANLKRSIDRLS